MAKFGIYHNGGNTPFIEGTPVFSGVYMKPGVLEFREIASPVPIDWVVGDYVNYTRTNLTYRLYSLPQMKKQANYGTYGAAYVYQNVQLHDASYELEICRFRDLVKGDNRIHFSTQPMISVFDNVAGIAERLQACLEDMYGDGSWVVRCVTTTDWPGQEVPTWLTDRIALMNEDRNYAVEGVSILGALDKVYEVWSEIGWIFKVINGQKTIIIGGAGLNLSTAQNYLYGKGNGLKNITRNATNKDELANRLFVYGSSRNMLSGWYRNQNIKDAESVDIQHLMLPIDAVTKVEYPDLVSDYPGWGKSVVSGRGLLPDAAKAFVEDEASQSRLGLRPKVIYFDGTGDTEEIYPTIRGMKISDVRAVVPSGNDYYPSASKYPDANARVDVVKSVETVFDSGLSADSGKQSIQAEYSTVSVVNPIVLIAGETTRITDLFTMAIEATESGKLDYSVNFDINGAIGSTDAVVTAWLEIMKGDTRIGMVDIEVTHTGNNWSLGSVSFEKNSLSVSSGDTITAKVWVQIKASAVSQNDRQYLTGITAEIGAYLSRYREKTFKIVIPQIGFDIAEQAALGDGKTIHFRTGKCAGRTFTIKNCTFQGSTETWLLEIIRSEDESLSQWFPNHDYPVEVGNEFVLLDIAMPDNYVVAAEKRLLVAAQEYLEWSKKEVWQYTPEIDAEFMIKESRVINPAEYIILEDIDIVPVDGESGDVFLEESGGDMFLTVNDEQILLADSSGATEAILVDSVTINEGESTIPTYKVTLRERKRKTASNSAEVQSAQSKPVASVKENVKSESVSKGSDFFEEDGNGGVKLKDEYAGLWVPGWLASGGVGSSGGGGGDVDLLDMWVSLRDNESTDEFYNWKVNAGHLPLGSGLMVDPQTGLISVNVVSGVSSVAGLTGAVTDTQLKTALRLKSLAYKDTPYDFTIAGVTGASYNLGDIATLNGYFENSKIKSSALPNMYIGSTLVQFNTNEEALTGISTINASGLATVNSIKLGSSTPVMKWENNAWHLNGNLYVDGWLASGGVGTTSSSVDLVDMWASLTSNNQSDEFYNYKINAGHLPLGSGFVVNSQTGTISVSAGTVTGIKVGSDGSVISPVNGILTIPSYPTIPQAIKNPYALTFGSKTYDGSAAKEITASDLGALTAHQPITLASGTNNGTLKITTAAGTTDNIAVKGLGDAAYKGVGSIANGNTGLVTGGAVYSHTQNMLTASGQVGHIGIPVYIGSDKAPHVINYLVTHPENSEGQTTIFPYINNDLAFLKARGGDYSISGATSWDDAFLFDGSARYGGFNNISSSITITILVPTDMLFDYGEYFYIDFGNDWWAPSSITLKVYTGSSHSSVSLFNTYSVTGNTLSFFAKKFNVDSTPVQKLEITLSGFNSDGGTPVFRIAQIGLLPAGTYGARVTYMSRGIDDKVWRNISPISNSYNLGESSSRWGTLYANIGNLSDSLLVSNRATVGSLKLGSYSPELTGSSGEWRLSGNLRLRGDSETYGRKLILGDGDYVFLYEDADDHLQIKGVNGVELLTGSNYGIKYGDAVLKWDSVNNAWHLEGNFYADGFIASGGIGSTNTLLVTLAGTQTITGAKTFDLETTFEHNIIVKTDSTFNSSIATPKITPIEANGCLQLGNLNSQQTVAIGTNASGTYKLYVSGTCYATSYSNSSDKRFKNDLTPVFSDRALAVLMQLKPMEWTWNEKNMYLEGKRGAGLVAQDVLDVLPFAVTECEDYLGLNYSVLHAYEIAGLQNHEKRIAELEKENKELREKLAYVTQ